MTTIPNQVFVDRSHRPLAAFCVIVGAAALWISRDYETGTVIAMGPGFFPKAVAGLLIFLGIVILLVGGRDVEPDDDSAKPTSGLVALGRIVLCVIGSIVLFGLALQPLGLPIATFLMVALASLARREAQLMPVMLTALILSVLSTILFALLLQLQIPVLPEFAR